MSSRIVEAFENARQAGSGAVQLDGVMIDIPVVERARKTLARQQLIAARNEVNRTAS